MQHLVELLLANFLFLISDALLQALQHEMFRSKTSLVSRHCATRSHDDGSSLSKLHGSGLGWVSDRGVSRHPVLELSSSLVFTLHLDLVFTSLFGSLINEIVHHTSQHGLVYLFVVRGYFEETFLEFDLVPVPSS